MISVQFDSELMTNYVAAVPAPGSSRFATCLDPDSHGVVVFALSNDENPKFQMIKQDKNGDRRIHDLNKKLKITENHPIQNFELQQADDLKVYLVIATKHDDMKSDLVVVKPFDISEDPHLDQIPAKNVGRVDRIWMHAPVGNSSYPMIVIANQPLGSIHKASDITRISVSLESNSWDPLKDMELPANTADIFSVAPAKTKFGEGLFALAEISGTTQRELFGQFLRMEGDDPFWYSVKLKCPTGASSLATFNTARGNAALLVACQDGLRYFDASGATNKNIESKLICSDPLVRDATELIVAQDSDQLSIWVSNKEGKLSYITTTIGAIGEIAKRPLTVVQLLDRRTTKFSTCIARPNAAQGRDTVWQALIANDDHGNLTMLDQHRDTGIWRPEPFVIAYTKKNVEVESYTISMQLKSEDNMTLSNAQLFVRSSSAVTAIVNGKTVLLSASGVWLNTDELAELNLIVPATSISGQAFTVAQARDADGADLDFKKQIFDPSRKVLQAMSKLVTVDMLKNATTKDNKPLWDANNRPSDEDLKQAASCFQAMHQATQMLPADGKSIASTVSTTIDTAAAVQGNIIDGVAGALMDGFFWIKQHLSDAWDWVVEKAGEVWQFACKIGNAIKTFTLDCLEKIGEAATWVFEKIKLGWNKVKSIAGFIFSWSDILETKNSVKAILNSGLDLGMDKLESLVPKIDSYFDGLKGQVILALEPPAENISGNQKSNGSSKSSDVQSSVAFKWTSERLKNGGVGGGAVLRSTDPTDKAATDSWKNDFKPLLESVENAAIQTGLDIAELFKKNGAVRTDDLLKTGKNFLVNVLEVLKQFAITITKSIKRLIGLLKDVGNKKIDLWIFSDLYESITGNDLTLFDAISLIVAIPTCILIKAITGEKPADFTKMDSALLGKLVSGDKSLSSKTKSDFNTLTAGMALGVLVIKSSIDLIKLIYKSLTQDADAALGTFTPGKTIRVISVGLDILGIINALPGDEKLPAPTIRKWISALSFLRASTNALALIITENAIMEKVELCVNLVVTLANFGLYQAVYYFELKEKWDDKDDATTALSIIGNTLNAIAGVGSFAAHMGKLHNPKMTAVGVIVLSIGTYGFVAIEGIKFDRSYQKSKPVQSLSPAF